MIWCWHIDRTSGQLVLTDRTTRSTLLELGGAKILNWGYRGHQLGERLLAAAERGNRELYRMPLPDELADTIERMDREIEESQ